jgi:phospholipase D1/2
MPIYKFDWKTHRRLKFCLDDQHPVGASQHQKVVVIDDGIAFAGGLDITRGRWDTSEHRPDDPRRRDDDKTTPRPYHDVQMAVAGNTAAALGDLARQRWLRATGKRIMPPTIADNPWPTALNADVTDVNVAIMRTEPRFKDHEEIREVEAFYLDAINAARHLIYIENQYFTAGRICTALRQRLQEEDGPEIILLLPLKTDGWLAQNTMDVMREQLIKDLKINDRYNRFQVYYPHIPNQGDQVINLHAKVLIIDDELLRIGSSNLNNRSMGLDSECDLAIEACGDPRIQGAVANLRNRLLSEHLNIASQEVARKIRADGSAIAGVEALCSTGRSLRRLPLSNTPEPDVLVSTEEMIDPERPIDPDELMRQIVYDEERPSVRNRIGWWLVLLLSILALVAAWRWTPLNQLLDIDTIRAVVIQLKNMSATPLLILVIYLLGSIIAVPLTLLIIVTMLVFGSWLGFIYALSGSMVGAIGSYFIGYFLGRKVVRKLAGSQLNKLSRRLARRGLMAVIAARIVPVAPFTVLNMVAGASHISFRDYFIGTFIGMTPGIIAIALFTDRIIASIRSQDLITLATLAGITGLIAITAVVLFRWLSRHTRSESA